MRLHVEFGGSRVVARLAAVALLGLAHGRLRVLGPLRRQRPSATPSRTIRQLTGSLPPDAASVRGKIQRPVAGAPARRRRCAAIQQADRCRSAASEPVRRQTPGLDGQWRHGRHRRQGRHARRPVEPLRRAGLGAARRPTACGAPPRQAGQPHHHPGLQRGGRHRSRRRRAARPPPTPASAEVPPRSGPAVSKPQGDVRDAQGQDRRSRRRPLASGRAPREAGRQAGASGLAPRRVCGRDARSRDMTAEAAAPRGRAGKPVQAPAKLAKAEEPQDDREPSRGRRKPRTSASAGRRTAASSPASAPRGGNEGINIAVPEGTQVKAAENGIVAYAGQRAQGLRQSRADPPRRRLRLRLCQ